MVYLFLITCVLLLVLCAVSVTGEVVAQVPNIAVPMDLLKEIRDWMDEELDVVTRLRQRTVPCGYTPGNPVCACNSSMLYSLRLLLKSIVLCWHAQLEYRYIVCLWQEHGVPFKEHLYVPEVHPDTGARFQGINNYSCTSERIGQSLRQGGPSGVKVERFEEALHDNSTHLTYPALSGARKSRSSG